MKLYKLIPKFIKKLEIEPYYQVSMITGTYFSKKENLKETITANLTDYDRHSDNIIKDAIPRELALTSDMIIEIEKVILSKLQTLKNPECSTDYYYVSMGCPRNKWFYGVWLDSDLEPYDDNWNTPELIIDCTYAKRSDAIQNLVVALVNENMLDKETVKNIIEENHVLYMEDLVE